MSRLGALALAVTIVLSASPASASAETASLTYPVDGATKVDTTQPFTWTAVAGAHQYYL